MNRRGFFARLLALLPAAVVAPKVKASEQKPKAMVSPYTLVLREQVMLPCTSSNSINITTNIDPKITWYGTTRANWMP
jgi:hypothetical protein